MKYYKNGLIYDTDTAVLIAETPVECYGDNLGWLGSQKQEWYKTPNGNYFTLYQKYNSRGIFYKSPGDKPIGEKRLYPRTHNGIIMELQQNSLHEQADKLAKKHCTLA